MERQGDRKKAWKVAAGILCVLVLGLQGASEGAAGVVLDYYGQISIDKSVLQTTGRIAVGGDGTLYVMDGYRSSILKIARDGNYLGDLRVPEVSAVAAAPDGTLYIGSHKDFSVAIYRGGVIVGKLGRGANEFSSIRDIAVDAFTGNVLVVDNAGNAVRIFDGAGAELKTVTDVKLPVGVAVTDRQIVVLDAPVAPDGTTMSRISIFDRNFRLVRTVEEFGADPKMVRPTDIVASADGIFVTDAALKAVVVYDAGGSYVGKVQGVRNDLRTAVSLALSEEGMLYVASSETSTVELFAINGAGLDSGPAGK